MVRTSRSNTRRELLLIATLLDAPETDLWAEAIRELDESDRALIWGHAANKLNVLDDVLESAKEKERLSKQKRWTYRKRDGTKGELHDLFNRVVDRVAHFKKLGDSIAALDPTHLAIPWAAVGLGLQVGYRYLPGLMADIRVCRLLSITLSMTVLHRKDYRCWQCSFPDIPCLRTSIWETTLRSVKR